MAGNLNNAATPITSSLAKLQSLNGLFAIYKKQGPTSADVLNALKEALLIEAGVPTSNSRKRKKQWLKMGHGGTLDSAASGVLVIGVGNGTKMLSTMLTGSKKYVAVGELGKATDTLDATGTVIMEKEFVHISRLDMEEKLKAFTGDIMQVPPLYSALKKDGQRLSVLLKKGHQVEAKPARPVTVFSLTLQEFKPPLFSLALSSCAHVKELIRTKQSQFTLQDHVLHEEQWTLEYIHGALQPCSEGDQRSDYPKSPLTGT
ncbi:probable tRNA pseudouridine synthase 1 isoform X2 [Girardinichthys multiradiatus]|uniref:probable tRNA pseudouridine synthase 1 isoform X2 n=1 Tax=Girardinichthys multiradiatus TaxID=208333 RepID=UPI001FABD44D|nr:probable tRNA pseudouridine synthase 1 isoform X2 [Girardinichthys multiradiatus]